MGMVGRWVGGVRVRQTAAGGGRGQEGGEDRRGEGQEGGGDRRGERTGGGRGQEGGGDRRGEGTGGGWGVGGKQLQDGGSLGAVTRRT